MSLSIHQQHHFQTYQLKIFNIAAFSEHQSQPELFQKIFHIA